ncbi:MAG: glycosyltransferase family A protein [Cyanobacteria bacterium J06632_22]
MPSSASVLAFTASSTDPLVSVIIPIYNGARFVADAIATIDAQNYAPIEIVTVDDGSTDHTRDAIAVYGERVQYHYQANQGPAAARNQGLALAKGDYIAFLDVDDQWPADKLRRQLAAFQAQPHLEIVNGYVQLLKLEAGDNDSPEFQAQHNPMVSFNLGSALFRRTVFDRTGPFDASQIHSEDVDWFMKARELQVPMVVLEAVTLLYRKHETNLTHDRQENLKGFMQALHKSIHRRRAQGKTASLSQLSYLDANGEIFQRDGQQPAVLKSNPVNPKKNHV